MNKIFWLTGIALAALSVWESMKSRTSRQSLDEPQHQQFDGYSVTRTPLPGNQECVRFRGSYDDIMRALGVVEDAKPPLPADLQIDSLPEYHCGCPHCGKMSIVGENMWRYQELSRTRGCYNNTTTFLTKCKNCQGFMRSTVDHDD
jgi:hypothetical protein